MTFAGHILLVLAALGYLLAFAVGLPALRRHTGGRLYARCATLTVALVALAFVCQTAGMVLRGLGEHRCPLDCPADVLQIVAWSLVVMYGIVGAAFRTSLLGLFTSALAALICVGALLVGDVSFGYRAGAVVLVHAWLSLFSYGAFGLLALTSAMYLIQLHGIRKRRWARIFALLPSLRELEHVNLRLLVAAAAVYTVAVGLGAWSIYAGHLSVGPAKLLLASLVWLGYAAALALRLTGFLHGRRLAVAALALFALALVTLYPVERQHGAGTAVQPDAEATR